MQVDPVGGDGQALNPYSYLGNNPLSGTDPTGYEKECDESGANCSLTDVKSITVYQPHDGGKAFAVATDNQGNQIKAEAITNGSSTGVNGTMLTQGTLNGIINHDASSINALSAVGFGGKSVATGSGFDANAYDIHERNSHAKELVFGFGREMGKSALVGVGCTLLAEACLAYGGLNVADRLADHDPAGAIVEGAFTVAGYAGARSARGGLFGEAPTLRGPTEGALVDGEVTVPASRYPESAQHIQDAQAAGQPKVLTIDREGAAARRREALKGTPARSGSDRDEYPPAMFREGGRGASVRHINPSDNRGAGNCIGAQCQGLPNGARVRVTVDGE